LPRTAFHTHTTWASTALAPRPCLFPSTRPRDGADHSASADSAALAVIAVATAARLVLAAVLGLGVDEAYTLSVAHDLRLSYYDHPPLQYWIAHFFMPLLGDSRAARLPFIAMFAASSWLLYRLTRRLFSARAGVAAVLALNCSAFFTFAGGWLLPDGPLMLALLGAAVVLARHFFAPAATRPADLASWLVAGLCIGVAALAKYHALLFALGLLIFLISDRRRRSELRHAPVWLGVLLALLVSIPVLVWNAQHDWISVAYQAGRGRVRAGLHPEYVLANIVGQALWMLPWIFAPMVVAAWRAARAGWSAPHSWYCLCLGLPAIAVFTIVPLWGGLGLPHWQMAGWLMLYPLLGEHAVRALAPMQLRRIGIACVSLVLLLGALLLAHAVTGYGRILAPRLFAHGDPTLDAFEWRQLPGQLRARGLLPPGVFLITTNWTYAGRIDQALHDTVPVVVFGGNPKQFALRYDPEQFLGRDALVIGPTDTMEGVPEKLRLYFVRVEELEPVTLGRSGMREIPLSLLWAHHLLRALPRPYPRTSSAATESDSRALAEPIAP
jgi:Dolichyl-phosphate-mannose-protein mannosyltransferase